MATEISSTRVGMREKRKAERRAAIVAVAARNFLEHGYAQTTMSGIASELGGSKGTLWSYFRSKEDLFEAVIDQVAASLKSESMATLDPMGELPRVLVGFVARFIESITSRDAITLQRMIIGECERFPEIGRIFYARAVAEARELLAAFLAKQADAGLLRQHDSLQAAEMLLSLCGGGLHQRLLWGAVERTRGDLDVAAEAAVEQFLLVYSLN